MKTLLFASMLSLVFTCIIPATVKADPTKPKPTLNLRNFVAAPNNGNVRLDWIATAELLNGFFEVERSTTLSGNYEKIATIPLRKKEDTKYWYIDVNPSPTTNYYRIRIVDANRNTTYTRTIGVHMDGSHFNVDNLYPSVAQDQVNLQISTGYDSRASITLVDMSGRNISLGSIELMEGTTKYPINISTLNKGSYTLFINNGNKVINRRFVKQ